MDSGGNSNVCILQPNDRGYCRGPVFAGDGELKRCHTGMKFVDRENCFWSILGDNCCSLYFGVIALLCWSKVAHTINTLYNPLFLCVFYPFEH